MSGAWEMKQGVKRHDRIDLICPRLQILDIPDQIVALRARSPRPRDHHWRNIYARHLVTFLEEKIVDRHARATPQVQNLRPFGQKCQELLDIFARFERRALGKICRRHLVIATCNHVSRRYYLRHSFIVAHHSHSPARDSSSRVPGSTASARRKV